MTHFFHISTNFVRSCFFFFVSNIICVENETFSFVYEHKKMFLYLISDSWNNSICARFSCAHTKKLWNECSILGWAHVHNIYLENLALVDYLVVPNAWPLFFPMVELARPASRYNVKICLDILNVKLRLLVRLQLPNLITEWKKNVFFSWRIQAIKCKQFEK